VPEHDFGINEIFRATEGDKTDFGGHGRGGAREARVSDRREGGRFGGRVFRTDRNLNH
jgi:hypothetical protein